MKRHHAAAAAAANDEHDVYCCGHGHGGGDCDALDLGLSCDLSHSAVGRDSWCDCDVGAHDDDDKDDDDGDDAAYAVDDW